MLHYSHCVVHVHVCIGFMGGDSCYFFHSTREFSFGIDYGLHSAN